MGFDIGGIGKSLIGDVATGGLSALGGSPDGIGKILNVGTSLLGGLSQPDADSQNSFQDSAKAGSQNSSLQAVLDFALNLVKMVLDFAQGKQGAAQAAGAGDSSQAESAATTGSGTAAGTSTTTAATQSAEQPNAAQASEPTTTKTEPKTLTEADLMKQLKDSIAKISKQLTALSKSLSKLVNKGKTKGTDLTKSLGSLLKKGVKLGTQVTKFAALLGV